MSFPIVQISFRASAKRNEHVSATAYTLSRSAIRGNDATRAISYLIFCHVANDVFNVKPAGVQESALNGRRVVGKKDRRRETGSCRSESSKATRERAEKRIRGRTSARESITVISEFH